MEKNRDKFVRLIAEITKDHPAFIHIDIIGLTKIADSNESRLEKFAEVLRDIESEGGNICIPSYTLSYTRNEDYDILNSPVINAGAVSEFVRSRFPDKRTADALFSYIVFGKNISKSHFEIKDYDSFGKNSLIEEVFYSDGYIWTIGGVFKNSTEIHFIEKLLNVDYREDKVFTGNIIDREGISHKQSVTFFCKNFDFHYWYDFKNVENDIRKEGLMEVVKSEGYPLFVSGIKFKTLFEFLKKKVKEDNKYICKDLHHKND